MVRDLSDWVIGVAVIVFCAITWFGGCQIVSPFPH